MARMSADTLKVRGGSDTNGKAGRRPQSGNAAKARVAEPVEPEAAPAEAQELAADEPVEEAEAALEEPTEAAPEPSRRARSPELTQARRPMPKPDRAAQDEAAVVESEAGTMDDTLQLGKLARFAIEEGLPIDELAERLRAMVAAYDAVKGG